MSDAHADALASRARRLLEGIVPDGLLASYIPLLLHGGCRLEDAARLLGNDDHIELLVGEGMAYLQEEDDGSSTLAPASPDLTLQRALARLAGDLAAEHQRLLDAQERLRAAQTAADSSVDGAMEQLVQILTDQNRIAELTTTLIRSAQRDWLILGDRIADDRSADTPAFCGRASVRAIYESGCVESPVERERVDTLVRAGATVRLLPEIGMSMRLADEAIGLIPLAERGSAGVLLIQSSVIVGALREYFELLWERANPYGAPEPADGPLLPIQMQILQLLVQGAPDKAIADQVGVSVTTVGRHVNAIRAALGVRTRFAVGAEAVRQGLID